MARVIRFGETEADGKRGYAFRCPGCETLGKGVSPNHQFTVPPWGFDGNLERPTVDGSVLVFGTIGWSDVPFRCHSFIRDGQIQYLDDCSHSMRGMTVDLPKWST